MEEEILTTLMGLVEIGATTASRELSSMERVRLARACRNAVSQGVSGNCRKSTTLKAKDNFTNVEAMSKHVQIKLRDADISIIHEDKMINHHAIKDISSVAALVDIESQVVYIGHCSIRNKVIAVILSFGTLKCARALVNNIQQNQKAVERSDQFQAKDMVGVFKNTLRLSSEGEPSVKQIVQSQPNTPNSHITNTDKQTAITTSDTKIISSSSESEKESTTEIKNNESDNKSILKLSSKGESSVKQLDKSEPKSNNLNLHTSNVVKQATIASLTDTNIISGSNESEKESTTDIENNESDYKPAPIPPPFPPLQQQNPKEPTSSSNSQSSTGNDSVSTIDISGHNSTENTETMPAPIPQTFAPLLSLQPDSISKTSNTLKIDSSLVTEKNDSFETDNTNKDKDKKQCKLDKVPPSNAAKVKGKCCYSDETDNQNNNKTLKSLEEKTTEEVQETENQICTNNAEKKKKKKSFLSTLKVSRSNRRKYRHQPHIQFLISQINSTDFIDGNQRNSIISDQQIFPENHNDFIKITGKSGCISDFSDSDEDNAFNKGDHLYGLLGLKREEQERIYIDFSQYESIPGETPEEKISNQINYLLNDEYMYLETTKLLAVGKDSFPEDIQLLLEPLETLPEFHDNLYRSLYDGLDDNSKIASAFLERNDSFPVYESILVNSFDVERIISIIPESEKTGFVHLLEPLKIARRRLHFYFTILDSMLKLTSSEKNTLQEAADMLRGYCQRADTNILINSIRNSPINLHIFKPLLLHSCFNVSGCKLDETKSYRVLLFETLMVVTVTNKHYNDYQFDIRIELAHLTSDEDDNIFSLEIERGVFKREKYVFKTTEKYIKKIWCNEIADIQKKYLEKIENTLG